MKATTNKKNWSTPAIQVLKINNDTAWWYWLQKGKGGKGGKGS